MTWPFGRSARRREMAAREREMARVSLTVEMAVTSSVLTLAAEQLSGAVEDIRAKLRENGAL